MTEESETSDDLVLTSINGVTPEEWMKYQTAREQRVRRKNIKETVVFVLFIGLLALLAQTQMQYIYVGVIAIGGYATLWTTQSTPFGPDGGIPHTHTHGMPPIIGLFFLAGALAALISFLALCYSLIAGLV